MQEFHRIKKLNENLYQKRFFSISELEKIVDKASGQKNLLIVIDFNDLVCPNCIDNL